MRRLTSTLLAAIILGGLALTSGAAAASGDDIPKYYPSRLAHVGEAGQVIVVTSATSNSSYGTLRAYERDGQGGWTQVVEATPARLGWSGLALAADRRQGTGKTPAGTFGIVSAFGRKGDPGTALPYTQVDRNDAWTYNPKVPSTYNMFQSVDRSWSSYSGYVEHLWSYGMQYDYVAVLDYNLPSGPITTGPDGVRRTTNPADTRAGGGIFLHVTNGKVTAGCIAIPEAVMKAVLRWLKPSRNPVIVIGTEAAINRM
jgi:L,D-peptidoglycan transpeptidase YkuD (ErfK/YbiS/YcfS/YnhG family)